MAHKVRASLSKRRYRDSRLVNTIISCVLARCLFAPVVASSCSAMGFWGVWVVHLCGIMEFPEACPCEYQLFHRHKVNVQLFHVVQHHTRRALPNISVGRIIIFSHNFYTIQSNSLVCCTAAPSLVPWPLPCLSMLHAEKSRNPCFSKTLVSPGDEATLHSSIPRAYR